MVVLVPKGEEKVAVNVISVTKEEEVVEKVVERFCYKGGRKNR